MELRVVFENQNHLETLTGFLSSRRDISKICRRDEIYRGIVRRGDGYPRPVIGNRYAAYGPELIRILVRTAVEGRLRDESIIFVDPIRTPSVPPLRRVDVNLFHVRRITAGSYPRGRTGIVIKDVHLVHMIR